MSAIAESLRRQRLPLLTTMAVLVASAGVWALLAQTATQHRRGSALPVAAPEIEQAPWKVTFSAEGRFGKPTKSQREAFANQRKNVAAVITGIYDGIFLEPARLDAVVKASFSREAARSLRTNRLSFPKGATEVTTTYRRARIGLEAERANFAIGRVTVLATAMVQERKVELEHRSTLWLERAEGSWQIIAFDVEQGPTK